MVAQEDSAPFPDGKRHCVLRPGAGPFVSLLGPGFLAFCKKACGSIARCRRQSLARIENRQGIAQRRARLPAEGRTRHAVAPGRRADATRARAAAKSTSGAARAPRARESGGRAATDRPAARAHGTDRAFGALSIAAPPGGERTARPCQSVLQLHSTPKRVFSQAGTIELRCLSLLFPNFWAADELKESGKNRRRCPTGDRATRFVTGSESGISCGGWSL